MSTPTINNKPKKIELKIKIKQTGKCILTINIINIFNMSSHNDIIKDRYWMNFNIKTEKAY